MPTRIRRLARRWPRAFAALVLAVGGGQGFAGALDWCLHDTSPQVVSAVQPCHADSGSGSAPATSSPHVEAAPDAGLLKAPPVSGGVGPSAVLFRLHADSDPGAGCGSGCAAPARWRALRDAGPPCDPASPGHSIRLLI